MRDLVGHAAVPIGCAVVGVLDQLAVDGHVLWPEPTRGATG